MAQIENIEYHVACLECGSVFSPQFKSRVWWRAHQRAAQGFLDAVHVGGDECGCRPEERPANPNKPYRVFGYDALCEDYDYRFSSMTEALKAFIKLNRTDIVFITGVSPAVQDRLRYPNAA